MDYVCRLFWRMRAWNVWTGQRRKRNKSVRKLSSFLWHSLSLAALCFTFFPLSLSYFLPRGDKEPQNSRELSYQRLVIKGKNISSLARTISPGSNSSRTNFYIIFVNNNRRAIEVKINASEWGLLFNFFFSGSSKRKCVNIEFRPRFFFFQFLCLCHRDRE